MTDAQVADELERWRGVDTTADEAEIIRRAAAALRVKGQLVEALEEGCDFHKGPLYNGWAHRLADGKTVRCRLSETQRAALKAAKETP